MAEKLRFYSSSADNLDAMAVDTDSSVATSENVKNNYLFKDAITRELLSGTMPINTSETIVLDLQDVESGVSEYVIPKGYHDGTGKVITKNLKYYTPGDANEEDVVNNKVFWVNGVRKVGSLNVEMAEQEATATSDDLLEGKTAWANKVKLVGTIPTLPKADKILQAGESYTIPYGLSIGTTVISAESLEDSTPGNVTAEDIALGKTAWVNGKKVIGTFNINNKIKETLSDTNATKAMVLEGKKFYSAVYDQTVSGTMVDHTGEATVEIPIGTLYAIPSGYYDGSVKVRTKSLRDSTIGTATDSNILINKTAWVNGEKITGSMPYNDPAVTELDGGVTYTIPKGYHTGNGYVVTKSISKQTIGTATADDILAEKTAWVNGEKVIGTMANNKDLNQEITPGETFYVPNGFHSGTGTVWVKPLKAFTEADAEAKYILKGKTAWVNGEKITGSMISVESEEIVLDAGVKYNIPEGYHDGTGTIEAESMEVQTKGTATAGDIIKQKTAWVNGEKITGSLELSGSAALNDVVEGSTFYNIDVKTKLTGTLKLTGTATDADVLEGVSFYSNNPKRKLTGSLKLIGTAEAANVLSGTTFYNTDAKVIVAGSMPNNGSIVKQLDSGETYNVPEGYHDGTGVVRAPTIESVTVGTAEASDIYKDKTAWVNGEKLTGTLALTGTATPDKVLAGYTYYSDNPKQILSGTLVEVPAVTTKIKAGEEYTITKGVHDGNGKVYAASLAEQTPGTAIASTILYSRTAWVNGEKVTGTMPNNGSVSKTLLAGESYTVPEGYHNGSGLIEAASLDIQTVADATAENILINKTAWVNGEKITGTMPQQDTSLVRINAGNDLTLPAGYYPNGVTIYSLYTDRLDLTGTNAWYEEADYALHPEDAGYVDEETSSLVITDVPNSDISI